MLKTSIPKLHSIKLKNSENVVFLDLITSKNIDPQRVLIGAINSRLEGVVIMGYTKEGEEYFASSYADGSQPLWLAERMKKALMDIIDAS